MKLEHLQEGDLFQFARQGRPEFFEALNPEAGRYQLVGVFVGSKPSPPLRYTDETGDIEDAGRRVNKIPQAYQSFAREVRARAASKLGLLARKGPLPRCEHGAPLIDGAGEILEPPCECRYWDRRKQP